METDYQTNIKLTTNKLLFGILLLMIVISGLTFWAINNNNKHMEDIKSDFSYFKINNEIRLKAIEKQISISNGILKEINKKTK